MKWFNRLLVRILPLFPKSFVWIFSKRYIAGIDLSDAIEKTKYLNADHILTTIDVLGEDITELEEAAQAREQCIKTVNAIRSNNLLAGLSIKLTQLGLCIDTEQCYKNVEAIVSHAERLDVFVRIDMEDSTTTDRTFDIYRRIRKKYRHVGIVVQAYLKRTKEDVRKLIDESISNIRICKGIYDENPEIAYKDADKIRKNYMEITEMALKSGEFTAIATHDKTLVESCQALIERLKLKADTYEYQMLIGVTEHLRSDIVKDGYPMRVYVPYGEQWHGYCMRRLKENPQVAGYVVKNIFIRN
ncbi:proline dehydrogenase family protein [bacterium]|nr:proline dehydrogenase family protein [bacterium]